MLAYVDMLHADLQSLIKYNPLTSYMYTSIPLHKLIYSKIVQFCILEIYNLI